MAQYTDYVRNAYDQQERNQQLIAKYSQKPTNTFKIKDEPVGLTAKDLKEAVWSVVIAGVILILVILFG